jgi:hypothetical protein
MYRPRGGMTMAFRVIDARVHERVSVPRFRIEEGLVDIQAASSETSRLLERGARYIETGFLPEAVTVLGHADTLVRGMGDSAFGLAGEVTACASGLLGPDGDHAA